MKELYKQIHEDARVGNDLGIYNTKDLQRAFKYLKKAEIRKIEKELMIKTPETVKMA